MPSQPRVNAQQLASYPLCYRLLFFASLGDRLRLRVLLLLLLLLRSRTRSPPRLSRLLSFSPTALPLPLSRRFASSLARSLPAPRSGSLRAHSLF